MPVGKQCILGSWSERRPVARAPPPPPPPPPPRWIHSRLSTCWQAPGPPTRPLRPLRQSPADWQQQVITKGLSAGGLARVSAALLAAAPLPSRSPPPAQLHRNPYCAVLPLAPPPPHPPTHPHTPHPTTTHPHTLFQPSADDFDCLPAPACGMQGDSGGGGGGGAYPWARTFRHSYADTLEGPPEAAPCSRGSLAPRDTPAAPQRRAQQAAGEDSWGLPAVSLS